MYKHSKVPKMNSEEEGMNSQQNGMRRVPNEAANALGSNSVSPNNTLKKRDVQSFPSQLWYEVNIGCASVGSLPHSKASLLMMFDILAFGICVILLLSVFRCFHTMLSESCQIWHSGIT